MDPFVTQIGDVTIQRVAPKRESPVEQHDVCPSEASPSKGDDTTVSSKAEEDGSESSENKEVKFSGPEQMLDMGSEPEPSSAKFKTEPSPVQDKLERDFETKDEAVDVKSENPSEPVGGDNLEDFAEEEKGEEFVGIEGRDEELSEEDADDEEGVMDASQFLEMAQAEAAEDDENDMTPAIDPFLSEEQDEALSDEGNEPHEDYNNEQPSGKKKRIKKDLVGMKPTTEYEPMDDDDVNGAVDGNYSGQEYENMEGESKVPVKKEQINDPNFSKVSDRMPALKSESDEKQEKVDEGGDDQQDGSEMKKKLRTRQKRKILVEEDTDESEEERKKKRKKRKKRGGDGSGTSEETESEDDGSGKKKKKKKKKPAKKTKKKDEDGSGDEKEKKTSNMRRNIRDIMDETELDEATVAAQRQEMERLRRVQEQQRILREMALQRQQQQRAEKVISILHGNTSILKQVSVSPSHGSKSGSSASSPNTVVVKVGSGSTAQSSKKVLELFRVPKGTSAEVKPSVTKTLLAKPQSLQGTTMMTPSVSIAPVRPGAAIQKSGSIVKQPSLIQAQASYSASEGEDDEDEENEEDIIDEFDEDGKKKKKDVVTISSSSEDDCIVLSEPSDIGEDEEEDDPTNSGMHTNDAFNVPDEQGRVQVNMGKPEGDPDIFLAPHIARIIKPHQIGGIRFLYDNIIESIERFESSTGFGCILAHSMGLGKTLQVITFCDIFLRHTPAKTVMCIMPINTLQNWLAEFNMWMPDDPMATPLAGQGEVRPRTFNIHVLNDSHKTLKARAKVIEDWSTGGGVLLIGYELYRQLSLKKVSKPKKSRRKRPPASDEEEVDPEEEEKRQKEMLEKVYEAIVKPGPDLVICDEGHRIKNSHASISMALKQIRSKRRVVLTGYPLQNNLLEYWCMVDFVRPNYLGTKTEFCNMFERPIQNGQCIDSTPQDIRLMRYRAHVLHSLLEGFVQRRSHSVLQAALPQKEEYVLLVRMTDFQRKLYDTFMNEVVRTKAVPNPLKAFAVCCKIWNHPDVLYQFLKKREGGEGIDLDLEEAAASLAANTVTDPTGTPVEERKAAPKSRGRSGSSKSRKKKEASPKPAAAVLPNTSSQSDSSNPYGLSSQYPMHSQINSSSMMSTYNPYGGTGQPPYGGFSAPPHHYNPGSSYAHPGYSGTSGFNSSSSGLSLNAAGQGSFPSSNSSGYGDSLGGSPASQSSQYGSSSSQSLFSSSTPSTPSASSTSGYGSMGPPYFSGNSPSAQHSMTDGFSSSSNYSQNWSSSSSYNSFNQSSSNSQSFSGSNYSSSGQATSFQGYNASNPSSSFNQSLYASGSSSSTSNPSQTYQPGLMDQQMLDQSLMAPPNRPSLNPNLIPQQSPVNASGMLPGGAPTKNPSMIPPNMGSSLMGSGMGVGLNSTNPGMGSMRDNMMGHHTQGIGMSSNVYQTPNMMSMPGQSPNHAQTGSLAALPSMTSADVPPSAEDLLRSTSDDFGAFNASLPKSEANRSMFDVKDRSLFDPWGNSHSHSQDYNIMGNQDLKPLQDSGGKEPEADKYNPGPSPHDQIKADRGDIKSEEKPNAEIESKAKLVNNDSSLTEQNAKGTDPTESWQVDSMEMTDKEKDIQEENKEKEGKEEEEDTAVGLEGKVPNDVSSLIKQSNKEDPGIPYDWAVKLMEDYVPGRLEDAAKMALFFCILEESLARGDRILLFSQSLFTLSLIEEYLQRSYIPVPGVYERWQRNRTYFRLDGSTAAIEREKLINEFNANPNVYLFLVSTRAGSLGINLVGANRVIVFDASWNPCHDTQAVCRVYRYGQQKPCYVYRFVMDSCLEKKIYDRQINKQGMSDRIVDECNPDAHLSIKDVTNLCWDDEKESEVKDFSSEKEKYSDPVMQKLLEKHSKLLTKAPFQHESLLVDRKDKKLSQAEKRLAKRSYEMEKRANNRPVYNYYNPAQGGLQIRPLQRDAAGNVIKPIASVRPMQSEINPTTAPGSRNTKWIPAEVWQRQGMSAQEMTLPLDVVIPTNSPERSSIVLKAGQRVMVLKSPKGIYMQLENGKIIAIRTAFKMGANNKTENKPFAVDKEELKKGVNVNVLNKGNIKLASGIHPLRNNPNITITPRAVPGPLRTGIRPNLIRPPGARMQTTANMRPWVRPGGVAGRAVPLRPGQNLRPGLRGLSPSVTVTPANAKSRALGPVTITPRLAPANFPGLKTPAEKDKAKIEAKADSKPEVGEKLENDDSSNSNIEAPATVNKANDSAAIIEDKSVDMEKAKELIQNSKSDNIFDSTPKSNQVNSENLSESKNLALQDSTSNADSKGGQDLSRSSLSDASSSSLKNFHLAPSSHGQDLQNLSSQESGESSQNSVYSGNAMYGSSEKSSSQTSLAYAGNFSSSTSSLNKPYNSSVHSGSMLNPSSYKTSTDLSKDSKSSVMENQWKSPPATPAFSQTTSSTKSTSLPRNHESPSFDDKSSSSVHSSLSSKSSNLRGSNLESRPQSSTEASISSYAGTDLTTSHGKSSSKLPTAHIPSSSPPNPKLNPPPSGSSSSISTPSSSTNFSPLDPYANLYGGYSAYSSSNYYNPYGYPSGFLADPKSSLSSKSSTDTNQSTSVPSSRSSSKSLSSRSESKKTSQESSRSTLPPAYESRQSSSSSISTTHSSRSGSSSGASSTPAGSTSSAAESAYSSSTAAVAAAAASAYNPMMMSPSFNPASCQYPPPSAASGSTNPFTAAAANYPSPYASPYGYPGANQFESEIARASASMYSAFHRPDPGLDPTAPYLPIPAHSRPVTGTPASAGSFYSQNVYGSQYGSTRDPYPQLPYPASPLFMPAGPYGGLASSASSTSTTDQSTSQ